MATVPELNTAAAPQPTEIENKPLESSYYFKILNWKSYNNTNAWTAAKPTSENAFLATVQSVAYKAASVFVALAETLTNILKAVYNLSFVVPANLIHNLVVKPEFNSTEAAFVEPQQQAVVVIEENEPHEERKIEMPTYRTNLGKAKDWVADTRIVKNYVGPGAKWASETRVVKATLSNARMPTRKETVIGSIAISAIGLSTALGVPAILNTAITYVPAIHRFI